VDVVVNHQVSHRYLFHRVLRYVIFSVVKIS